MPSDPPSRPSLLHTPPPETPHHGEQKGQSQAGNKGANETKLKAQAQVMKENKTNTGKCNTPNRMSNLGHPMKASCRSDVATQWIAKCARLAPRHPATDTAEPRCNRRQLKLSSSYPLLQTQRQPRNWDRGFDPPQAKHPVFVVTFVNHAAHLQ